MLPASIEPVASLISTASHVPQFASKQRVQTVQLADDKLACAYLLASAVYTSSSDSALDIHKSRQRLPLLTAAVKILWV
jgi:hypothetical protein